MLNIGKTILERLANFSKELENIKYIHNEGDDFITYKGEKLHFYVCKEEVKTYTIKIPSSAIDRNRDTVCVKWLSDELNKITTEYPSNSNIKIKMEVYFKTITVYIIYPRSEQQIKSNTLTAIRDRIQEYEKSIQVQKEAIRKYETYDN